MGLRGHLRASHQADQRGSLTVDINTSIANSHLPAIVQAFCQQFPQVKLTLHELASYNQIKQLNSTQIDIGCFHRHNLAALPEEARKVSR